MHVLANLVSYLILPFQALAVVVAGIVSRLLGAQPATFPGFGAAA